MKVKLRIPAVAKDGLHDVGEEVDFADPNQALALIRAGQADAVGEIPFPETAHERKAREDREHADAEKRKAEAASIPARPAQGHTPVPSAPLAKAAVEPKPAPATSEHKQAPNASAPAAPAPATKP